MAIQNRRGAYNKFDPSKLLPGEWACVIEGDTDALDGRAIYMCFAPGVVKRMATYQDMLENMSKLSEDLVGQVMKDFTAAMTAATAAANTAASEASTAAGTASQEAANAASQASAANTAATGANAAIQRINNKLEEMETAGPVLQSEKGRANGVAALDSSAKVPAAQMPGTINAATAAKLTAAKTIDGIDFDGSANINHFCICSTASATAAKTASLSGFKLSTGARAMVTFTYGCTAANPTLNINGTGAKAIYYKGAAVPAGYISPNMFVEMMYDGTQYCITGDIQHVNAPLTGFVKGSQTGDVAAADTYTSAFSKILNAISGKVDVELVSANGGKCWKFSNGLAIAVMWKNVSFTTSIAWTNSSLYYAVINGLGNMPITFKDIQYRNITLDSTGAYWLCWNDGGMNAWAGSVYPISPNKQTTAASGTFRCICIGTWK